MVFMALLLHFNPYKLFTRCTQCRIPNGPSEFHSHCGRVCKLKYPGIQDKSLTRIISKLESIFSKGMRETKGVQIRLGYSGNSSTTFYKYYEDNHVQTPKLIIHPGSQQKVPSNMRFNFEVGTNGYMNLSSSQNRWVNFCPVVLLLDKHTNRLNIPEARDQTPVVVDRKTKRL